MKVYVLFFCLIVTSSCALKPVASSTNPAPETNSSPLPRLNPTPTPDPFELTRDKVLALARTRMNKEVEAILESCECRRHNPEAYEEMIRAKVIECDEGGALAKRQTAGGYYLHCKPGQNGRFFGIRDGDMSIVVGRRIPAEVNGISKADRSSAVADVVLKFQPSSALGKIRRWLDQFQDAATFRPINMGDKQHRVYLRLYDDGWRIEKID